MDVDYLGETHTLKASEVIKINGILFLQDQARREDVNVQKCVESMERLLTAWSSRHLTLLGRILIIKTFAISQLIFLLQSMSIKDASIKKLTGIVFKYLWNKNFRGNRAPERLKRSIMYAPIKFGGFGMINLDELSKSLDLRSYGRLIISSHPFLEQLAARINVNDFFNVRINVTVDEKLKRAITLLNLDRKSIIQWPNDAVLTNFNLRQIMLGTKLKDLLTAAGVRSLHYLAIHRRVHHPKVYQLRIAELASVVRYLKEPALANLLNSLPGNPDPGDINQDAKEAYPKNGNLSRLSTLTSKEIRLARNNEEDQMINVYKIGVILTPGELLSWTKSIKLLTSTRHKNILLRLVHGDIFSNARLSKFGLRPGSECANCPELIETIKHRVLECPSAQEAWRLLEVAKTALDMNSLSDLTLENLIGAKDRLNKLELALQAELLIKLTSKGEGYCPKQLVESTLKMIENNEKLNDEKRNQFRSFRTLNFI